MMIHFTKYYKYQLAETYVVRTSIRPAEDIETFFVSLSKDGVLTIRRGYAWDGPSGPTFDTSNFMRGSLVHDSIYQLLSQNRLPDKFRGPADYLLRTICIEDGMSDFRAWYVWKAVRRFGRVPAGTPKEILTAP